MRVYLCKAMTGIPGAQLLRDSRKSKVLLESHGIEPLDPVLTEKVRKTNRPLHNSYAKLKEYWARDKAMIRSAHAIIDTTPDKNSEGVKHEIGYARYFLWKPVVRVYPNLGPSIARIEDDFIAGSLEEAAVLIVEKWGSRYKRFKWRLALVNRCLPKFLWCQLVEWIH